MYPGANRGAPYPPPPQQYGYPQPAYPPQPYGQQPYPYQQYNQNQYPPPPYGQPLGYPVPGQPAQPQHYRADGYPPAKKHKGNSGILHYPPQAVGGYPDPHAQAYQSQAAYQPQVAFPPPPPPGWVPPPPPGWQGQPQQAYPQAPQYPQPQGYQAPNYGQPPAPYAQHISPPVQQAYPQWPQGQPQHWQGRGQAYPRPTPAVSHSNTYLAHKTHTASSIQIVNNRASTTPAPSIISKAKSTPPVEAVAVKKPEYVESIDYVDWEGGEGDDYYDEKDELDPNLALGEIVWLPGKETSRPVAATFADAEIQAAHPAPIPEKGKRRSISKYATEKNQKNMCRPIRESDYWRQVKNDPVFAELPLDCEFWTVQEVVANRARAAVTPDPGAILDQDDREEGELPDTVADNWNVMDHLENVLNAEQKALKEVNPGHNGTLEPIVEDDDEEAYSPPPVDSTLDQAPTELNIKEEPTCGGSINHSHENVATSIENKPFVKLEDHAPVLLPNIPGPILQPRRRSSPIRNRSSSPGKRLSIPKPLGPPPKQFDRDAAQEDLLAKLGVTGIPRPVYSTPGPAYMPPPEGTARSRSKSPQRSPVHHTSSLSSYREREPLTHPLPPHPLPAHPLPAHPLPPPPFIPPPPPPQIIETLAPPLEIDPWTSGFGYDGNRDSPKSVTSQHTLAGSDFHADEPVTADAAPGTPEDTITLESKASTSRKRTRGDNDEEDDGVKRQKDDVTPRLRRRQPKVAAAYSRRW